MAGRRQGRCSPSAAAGLLLVVCLTAAQAATAPREGPLRRLLGYLRWDTHPTAPNAILPEDAPHQFIPPLWRTDDPDLIHPSASRQAGRALQHAAGDEEPVGAGDPDPDFKPSTSRPPLRNDDFVYAAPSTAPRLQLAQASRYWRKGMRAVFVTDQAPDKMSQEVLSSAAKYRESFAWFPNFRRMANDKRDHYLEGDRRAAMAPILAYATLADPPAMTPWTVASKGNATAAAQQPAADGAQKDPFKWMLAGDDDTVFFMRGVKALLRDYDPQLPYFLSDSMYVGSQSPQPGVWEMRCYPCHLQWGRWRRSRRLLAAQSGGQAVEAPKGCNCSSETLCSRRFPGNVSRCMNEWEGPVPFGGVGFIFSIGLFKALAAARGGNGLRAYEECVNAPNTSVMSFPEGGDAFMSRCLWRLGFPITDPGYTPWGRYMGEALELKYLYEAPVNLSKGQLPREALQRWSTGISMHLWARQQKSYRAGALTVKYLIGVYDLVAELLWPSARKA